MLYCLLDETFTSYMIYFPQTIIVLQTKYDHFILARLST